MTTKAESTPSEQTDSEVVIALATGRAIAPGAVVDPSLVARHGLVGLAVGTPMETDELRAGWLRYVARQRVMEHHLARLLTALDRAGVPATVVKGPQLGHLVYSDPTERTYTDIDLVIRRGDLDRTLALLAADPACAGIPPKRPRADKREVVFVDESGFRFAVDLHWDLFSYHQLRGVASEAMDWAWERSERHQTPLGPMWILPPEIVLSFLCTHAVMDHRFRLVLFRDLAEWVRRDVDWDRMVEVTERFGLASVVYLAFHLAATMGFECFPSEQIRRFRVPSAALRTAETLIPRTDLVMFDGHSVRLLNLAIVLVHDRFADRVALAVRAPSRLSGWRRRVRGESDAEVSPRITILVTSNARRGAEVFGEHLAEGLQRRRWEARLVSLWGTEETGVSSAVLTPRRPTRRWDRSVFVALLRDVRRTRPDVVFANGGATLRYAALVRLLSGRRHRLVYYSIGEPRYWVRSRLSRVLQWVLLRGVDRVLAVSEETRSQLVGDRGLAPEKVVTIPTGVPTEFFSIARKRSRAAVVVLFVGSLSAEKDPHAAVEVVAEAGASRDLVLRMVGEGSLRSDIEQAAIRAGVRLELTGQVADMGLEYSHADILLQTSKTEGLPGVVLEAGAAGLPVVAFDVGGTSSALVDGRTGFLVRERSVRAAAEAVRRLADSPTERRAMGERGRAFVAERFDMDRTVERFDEEISDLVRGRGWRVRGRT